VVFLHLDIAEPITKLACGESLIGGEVNQSLFS
jgi:hypothetical protein